MEKDEQEWPVRTGGQKFRASLVSQWVKILLQCRGHRCALTSSVPWTEEPGGLQSMGSQRVRQAGGLSIRATAILLKLPVIPKIGNLYQNVDQCIISLIKKVLV